MKRIPGLDGVRALAILAVLAYHILGLPGGFLGVDVFFVLSGFLITRLLLAEHHSAGRISLSRFYLRRARRLLPALWTMLAVVAIVGALWYPAQGRRLLGDLAAAFGYVTNWWLIAQGGSYFGPAETPPLLNHLWSLAVEEQFYLLWPLALIAFLHLGLTRRTVFKLLLAVIGASTLIGILLYSPWHDPSRVYFGTDTRLAALLVGVVLAILGIRPAARSLSTGKAAQCIGFAALAGLGILSVALNDHSPLYYRGGGLVVAAASGAVVVAACGGALGKLLGGRVLRWIGDRSYSMYLWHWPICVLCPWAPLRIAGTVVFAMLSYRYIEQPVRTGAGRIWRPRAVSVATGVVLIVTAATMRLAVAAPIASGAPLDPGPDVALGKVAVPAVTVSPARRPSHTGGVPRVAIFGDSQGMTLLRNEPPDTARYVRFADATVEGCGVLLGRVTSRSGERRDLTADCGDWPAKWRRSATRIRPDVGLIMVGAWEVFDRPGRTFGTPQWDADFRTALRKGVAIVRSSGARAALALLPCYRPVDGSAGFWPERGDDGRTRHVNDLLRKLAVSDGLSTVEPPQAFCANAKIARSRSYRWDGVHYYKPGAALYLRTAIPQLTAISSRTDSGTPR